MPSRLQQPRNRARRDGLPAALRAGAERVRRRTVQRIEDIALEAEGRLGVLGPAHRRWKGNSADDNRDMWNGWDWSRLGEEWTPSEEWKAGLRDDVLLRFVEPGGTVLEIGPGGGRWTETIAARSERTIVADVSERVLEVVVGRVSGVETVLSPGAGLPGVADDTVDTVWSFDVFVHIAPTDQDAYLREIARVLRPGGRAVVHHSDGLNRGSLPSHAGWRTPMTVELFRTLVGRAGLVHEEVIRTWSGGRHGLDTFGDAISVLRRPAGA